MTPRNWTNGGGQPINAEALNGMEADILAKVQLTDLMVPLRKFGTFDNTGVNMVSTFLDAAINSLDPGQVLAVPPGTYALDTPTVQTGKSFGIHAPGAKFIWYGDGNMWNFEGGFETTFVVNSITSTTVTIEGESQPAINLNLASPPTGWIVGDRIKVVAEDAIPGGRPGTGTKAARVGQFMTVHSVAGAVVTILGDPRLDPFTTGIRAAKLKPLTFRLTGRPTITADPATLATMDNPLLLIGSFQDPLIDTYVPLSANAAVTMAGCDGYDALLRIGQANNDPSLSQYGYGLQDSGSTDGRAVVRGGFVRHAFSSGSNQIDPGAALQRYGRTIDTHIYGVARHTSSTSWDTHAEADGVHFHTDSYNSNQAAWGVRGRNCTIEGYAYRPKLGVQVFTESGTTIDEYSRGHHIKDVTVYAPRVRLFDGYVNKISNTRDLEPTTIGRMRGIACPPDAFSATNMTITAGTIDIDSKDFTANGSQLMNLTRTELTIDNLYTDMTSITSAVTGLSVGHLYDNSTLRVNRHRNKFGSQALADKFAYMFDTSGAGSETSNRVDGEFTTDFYKVGTHFMPWNFSSALSRVQWRSGTAGAWSTWYTQFSTSTNATPKEALRRADAKHLTASWSLSANTTHTGFGAGTAMGQEIQLWVRTGTAGTTLTLQNDNPGGGINTLIRLKGSPTPATEVLAIGDRREFMWDGALWQEK